MKLLFGTEERFGGVSVSIIRSFSSEMTWPVSEDDTARTESVYEFPQSGKEKFGTVP